MIQCGVAVGSAFAMKKDGDAKGKEEGQIQLALRCSLINSCQAMHHFHRHEYFLEMHILSMAVMYRLYNLPFHDLNPCSCASTGIMLIFSCISFITCYLSLSKLVDLI